MAKMDKHNKNFLQPLNLMCFDKLQTDLLIAQLKG